MTSLPLSSEDKCQRFRWFHRFHRPRLNELRVVGPKVGALFFIKSKTEFCQVLVRLKDLEMNLLKDPSMTLSCILFYSLTHDPSFKEQI